MAICYNKEIQRFEYCSLNLSTYIIVGILVPLGIVLIILVSYLYLKCRQRQIRNRHRQQQQQQHGYFSTIVPIYNNEEEYPIPYTLSYPPNYTALVEENFDKLPSYEQSIERASDNNNINIINNGPATIPINASSKEIIGTKKTQT